MLALILFRREHETVCQAKEGCRSGGGGQVNPEYVGSNAWFHYVDHL
jgi:hypothetical protein